MIEGYTEGINWDFKERIDDSAGIIKDIMAFSNSRYEGDSYIIVGVKETGLDGENNVKVELDYDDRVRLNTTENYLYLPNKWEVRGLGERDLNKLQQISGQIKQQVNSCMLISVPECEFVPLQINKTRWLYIIIIKKKPGVYIAKHDLSDKNGKDVVKQGVIYIRDADTTFGADTNVASATECINVWKRYIDWLESPLYKQEKL